MQPSFRSGHECWPNGFLDEVRPPGTAQPVRFLFSLNVVDSLGGFSVILSIMHGTEVLETSFFLEYLPLNSLGADASQDSCLGMAGVTSAVLIQCSQDWRQVTPSL